MAVYRFRIIIEDHEDVFREIEIKATQTFEDLHKIIQEAFKFDSSQLASFYMSDDSWRKGKEITLMDMSDEGDDKSSRAPIMSKSILADFIDDPHQKIIYVFDFLAMWTFYLEMVKIAKEEPKATYPRITRSSGAAPKQYKSKTLPNPDEEDDEPKKKVAGAIFDLEEVYAADEHDGEEDSEDTEEGGTEENLEERGFHEEDF